MTLTSEVGRRRPSAALPWSTTERRSGAERVARGVDEVAEHALDGGGQVGGREARGSDGPSSRQRQAAL